MNSVINKKPKSLTNAYVAFTHRSAHYAFTVLLHLCKILQTQKLHPNKEHFRLTDVFKADKPHLSRIFFVLVRDFCTNRTFCDRAPSWAILKAPF